MFKTGKSTREAFGLALAEAGKNDAQIVVVDGDVHNSTRTEHFAKLFPERFFNVGIAESEHGRRCSRLGRLRQTRLGFRVLPHS